MKVYIYAILLTIGSILYYTYNWITILLLNLVLLLLLIFTLLTNARRLFEWKKQSRLMKQSM